MVEYTATFQLVKPIDMSKASRLMWHDVPNRSGRLTIGPAERTTGDIGLSSGWQGDNSGATARRPNSDYAIVRWRRTPIVPRSPAVSCAHLERCGQEVSSHDHAQQSAALLAGEARHVASNLDHACVRDHRRRHCTTATIAPTDWTFARCTDENPFPGTPDPTQVLPQERFRSKAALPSGVHVQGPAGTRIGMAAFRDVGSFFRNATQDEAGTPIQSPTACRGRSRAAVRSPAISFARSCILASTRRGGRAVYDGAWPIIAGRRIALNVRFGVPDGVLKLYEPGSEGRNGGRRGPIPVRGSRHVAFSTAARSYA